MEKPVVLRGSRNVWAIVGAARKINVVRGNPNAASIVVRMVKKGVKTVFAIRYVRLVKEAAGEQTAVLLEQKGVRVKDASQSLTKAVMKNIQDGAEKTAARKIWCAVKEYAVPRINAPEQLAVPRINSYAGVGALPTVPTVALKLENTAIQAELPVSPLPTCAGAMKPIRMQRMPSVPASLTAARGKDDTNNSSKNIPEKVVTLPSLFFSSNLLKTLNINMGKVSKVEVKDLKQSIIQAVKEIGGFSKYIKKGDVVLVKPNFNTADPFPASTDMEFLKTVVDLIYDNGAKSVIIGDSCTITQNTCRVMKEKGVFDLEDKTKVLVFEKHKWVKKEIPNGKYLKKVTVPEILDKVDKLILLPCIKTHYLATFTGSIKLSVGFMKPIERIALHARNLEEKIAEMNLVIKPDLIIMDARKCFITHGPDRGEVREPKYILASTDRVAIDIEGVKIIQGYEGNSLEGMKPEEITQIKRLKEITHT